MLAAHPNIEIEHRVVEKIPDDENVVLATGPLTASALAGAIQELLGDDGMLRLMPHQHDTDGFFAVRLIRGERKD